MDLATGGGVGGGREYGLDAQPTLPLPSFLSLEPPPPDRPYHSKRPHKKSRSGCKNCKARKVKCDEARPSCRSCVLRRTDCVYPNSAPPVPPASPAGSPRPQTPGSPAWDDVGDSGGARPGSGRSSAVAVVGEPQFRPSNVDEVDMKLLWFYTAETFSSFAIRAGQNEAVDNILKVRIPQAAFGSPFLMQCIFGLSALHLQFLHQDIDPARAITYRAQAFEGYRRAIEEGRPETFPALIACSLLLTALSSQMFREKDTKELYIIDWMVVWRGIGLMVEKIGPAKLMESGLVALFHRPRINLNLAALSIPNQLLFLVSSTKPEDPEFEHVELYYKTLKYLGSLYVELQAGFSPILNLRIITWFTFLPTQFIELARAKKPRALVIIAYYLVFSKLQHVWWMEGIGDREIQSICRYLGGKWYSWLRIPRMAVHVSDDLEIGRVLMENPEWRPAKHYDNHEDPRTKTLSLVDDHGKGINFDKKWILEKDLPPTWTYDDVMVDECSLEAGGIPVPTEDEEITFH